MTQVYKHAVNMLMPEGQTDTASRQSHAPGLFRFVMILNDSLVLFSPRHTVQP